VDVVEALLAAGAAKDAADGNDHTALHLASVGGHVEGVRFLVEAGVPVDVKDGAGRTDTSPLGLKERGGC
jgi:ankyrin repeat protein